MTTAPLIVTPGDPDGIGPEITVRALRDRDANVVIVGDPRPLLSFRPDLALVSSLAGSGVRVLAPPDGEAVEVASLRLAVAACLSGEARALVTGPIHKAKLSRVGFPYAGHTDFLGALTGVEHPIMAFVGGEFRVALVTVHLPLRAVPDALTIPLVLHTLRTAARSLREQLHLPSPRLAVCGLNPHAGEEGRLGEEENHVIGPACEIARAEGLDIWGPISAETAFTQPGAADMVVAMYHDQGLVALKRGDFGRSVNWTLGLPIVRTSVDHGTAYDLVGTGRARCESMEAAIALAERLTAR